MRRPGAHLRAPLAALVAAVALASCAGRTSLTQVGEPVAVDEPLAPLSGPAVLGGQITPADYEGKVLLVSVWATWCGPCRVEQPMLQRLWERYEDRGVAFLGIDIRDNHDAAVTWVKDEFNVTYPSIEDPYGGLGDDLGLIGVPATFVVDRRGTIRYRIDGLARESDLVRILEELLVSS